LETKALISVIIPAYNQGAYLADTLQSILNQSYQYWECIIVNDGSTDDTAIIAREWATKDARFQYIPKENGGVSSARNAGLKKASGAYIQFLDGDDVIGPDKFKASLEANADIVVSDFKMFRVSMNDPSAPFCVLKKELLNYETVLSQWDNNFNIPIHCGFFAQHILKDFTFNETLKAKEDWLLWIYVFRQSSQVVFIPMPLAFYRLHPKSMTMDKVHMNNYEERVYTYLFETLDEAGKKVLFGKMLNLYIIEKRHEQIRKTVNLEDYTEVEKGRKVLGLAGMLMYRTLRKAGHMAIKNEDKRG
jgi:glycosyltransferase involved in cell wall biosynthesis